MKYEAIRAEQARAVQAYQESVKVFAPALHRWQSQLL